jgi:hypothetical protein
MNKDLELFRNNLNKFGMNYFLLVTSSCFFSVLMLSCLMLIFPNIYNFMKNNDSILNSTIIIFIMFYGSIGFIYSIFKYYTYRKNLVEMYLGD